MTHTFGLSFWRPSPTDLPGPPIAQVMVKSLTDGFMITPYCVSPREFKAQIEVLKKDLEAVEAEGLRYFQEAERTFPFMA